MVKPASAKLIDVKKRKAQPRGRSRSVLSENALTILKKRYLKTDEAGKSIETPEDLFWRVAQNIAEADRLYGKIQTEVEKTASDFYELLTSFRFLPNSPCLRGAGRSLQQLSACFVLPIDDNMESIFDTLKDAALVHKTGGGTGFDFSRLRPKGDIIHSTGNRTPGPMAFLNLYNSMAGEVTQGGVRMGANMGILRADHPDIEDFISAKTDLKSITNFNISVGATDKFMKAVEEDKDYELINPRTKKVVRKVKAREVFDKACKYAWQTGDPGMVFIDRINNSSSNPVPSFGKIEATNPCGEQPLLPYESCVLGSINLAKHVKPVKLDKTTKYQIDWEKLADTVQQAMHFLDNVIDQNQYVVPEIEEMTKNLRRTGLGVMGFADLLVLLNIPYNSKESCETAKKVMKFINDGARKASEELAKERGPYPLFKQSVDYKKGKKPVRNTARTTIAPTGTISVIADCSSGIEPIFALVHRRRSIWKKDKPEVELLVVDKNFERVAKERGFYSEDLMEKVAEKGSIQEMEGIPKDVRQIFITAHDLTPVDHVRIQAAFQAHTDNAISKTINFPQTATVEDVKKAYLLAYKTGCKGITIYRKGSRELEVLATGVKDKKPPKAKEEPEPLREPRVRPEIVHGTTYKTKTAYGNLYVTVNQDENGKPFEVFAQMGKAGGFFAAKVEAISRLISLALRSGISVENVIDQLKGIRGPSPIWNNGSMILSLPDAIAKVLEKYVKRDQTALALDYNSIQPKAQAEPKVNSILQKSTEKKAHQALDATQVSLANLGVAPICPECSSNVEFAEGCIKCHSCGWSQCS